MSARIIVPLTIYPKTVFIPSRFEADTGLPGALPILFHGQAVHIPVIEVPCQCYRIGPWSGLMKGNVPGFGAVFLG
jgi:hypothetical protein